MALYSTDAAIDPHVSDVTYDIHAYFGDYIKYLLENEKDGVNMFISDDPGSMWLHFIDNYKERVKKFGLNPAYCKFKINKILFEMLLKTKKKELRIHYGIQ